MAATYPPDPPGLPGPADPANPADLPPDPSVVPETDAPSKTEQTGIYTGEPTPEPARAALVSHWITALTEAKAHWKDNFDQMREDETFAAGDQWPGDDAKDYYSARYVVNITLRHVEQRTATLYAKNPTAVAKVRRRLEFALWDGTMTSLQEAQQGAAMGDPTAMQLLQDVDNGRNMIKQKRRIAETLELLYDYNVDEQPVSFKQMLKKTVRRAIVTGVGYVKLTFQRATQRRPEVEAQIATLQTRLAHIQRIASDISEGYASEDDAEGENLRLQIQELKKQVEVIVREGLLFDYPGPTSIIVDPCCTDLRTFMGAGWVAQEYLLSPERVKEVYGIDVCKSYRAHYSDGAESSDKVAYPPAEHDKNALCCIWEIWSKDDQMQFVVCDGYPDFLQEPASPDTWMERFWPFFVLVLNACEQPEDIYPPSDICLIRHQQMEVNRAREGLREHRISNRPGTAVAAGMLDEEDRAKLQKRAAMDVVEINALAPGQRIEDILQSLKGPPVDPALYDVSPAYEDIQRAVGMQEANLGGTSGATATETSVAEASRVSGQHSNVDDLDDLLTDIARAGGQILLDQVSEQTVKEVVGPGAIWPKLSRGEIAREIYLETQAGSAGRPNKAIEMQQFQQMAPLLMQIPGITPDFLAREGVRRMNDAVDLDEAFIAGVPSVQAMNQMLARQAAGGSTPPEAGAAPAAQGPAGQQNAPQPPGPQGQGGRPPANVMPEGLPPESTPPALRQIAGSA